MNATVNLPVQSVSSIVNIDDQKLEMKIGDAIDYLGKGKDRCIRTLFADPALAGTVVYGKDKVINYNYGISFINRITVKPVSYANPGIKYFHIKVKYFNDQEATLFVPGFVKFFSKTTSTFVPVELIKKTDVLVDYAGNIVQMLKKTEYTDTVKLTEFYSIQVASDKAEFMIPFYFEGILSRVFYNDYQKDNQRG